MAFDVQIHSPAQFKTPELAGLGYCPVLLYARHPQGDRVWVVLPDGAAPPPGALRVSDGLTDGRDTWDYSTVWSVPVDLVTFKK